VAWRLDHLSTAFGQAAIEHSFGPLGEHTVVGLAIDEDGRATRLSTKVRVVTALASGCRCSLDARWPVPTGASSGSWPRALACHLWLMLLWRRRSRKKRLLDGNRNRLRADLGFGQT
jgi:hypothetical protein